MKKGKYISGFFKYLRSMWRWSRRGMAWPWVLILTGLATGIIAALTQWISQQNVPPGGM